MGWLKEKYTKEYFLQRDVEGNRLPYGVAGVQYWEKGEIYPEGKKLLDYLDLESAIVLDIGFGRGEAIKYCLQRGAEHVFGIDFSEAALEIAYSTLKGFSTSTYDLVCEDALSFFQKNQIKGTFSHILMLDTIEHIPRYEAELLLSKVYISLTTGGCCVVHTPFYPEDDDVLVTGGKVACKDSSDQFEQTIGMHINRYSYQGLGKQMKKAGFARWNAYIFLRPTGYIPLWMYPGPGRQKLAKFFKYKLR